MSIARKITSGASGSGGSGGYVDDVFSTYLYKGNGFSGNPNPNLQVVANGINLDDKGGLVWIKNRNAYTDHQLQTTDAGYALSSNSSAAAVGNQIFEATPDGFNLLTRNPLWNALDEDYASWTFAKQEGFFDIVTYSGDGVAGRQIPHNLGSTPGMIIVKSTTRVDSWAVYHRSMGNQFELRLDKDFAKDDDIKYWNYTDPTDTVFTVGTDSQVNGAGEEYVAYLFAHDAQEFGPNGDESIIKCGLFSASNYNVEEDLGWEPQWLLFKESTGVNDWKLIDNMRGSAEPQALLYPNEPDAEVQSGTVVEFTSRGFVQTAFAGSNEGIYMAIRRPNKPAEEFEPDKLFVTVDQGNPAAVSPRWISGFPVDMAFSRILNGIDSTSIVSRLTGPNYLQTNSEAAEVADTNITFDYPDGFHEFFYSSAYQAWMFRRAPGFFDVVVYTGDGTANRQVPHNLGATPQMVWYKVRDRAYGWTVYTEVAGPANFMVLNDSQPAYGIADMFPLEPTADTLELGDSSFVNGNLLQEYVAYLWASAPGICDIGSYTGTGANLNIDCGFTNGARFVLIKRTDPPGGDWYYWDTLRGITAGDDPYLLLNLDSAEVENRDYLDPLSSGFTVKATAPSDLNASGGNYLYMAIA